MAILGKYGMEKMDKMHTLDIAAFPENDDKWNSVTMSNCHYCQGQL